MEALRHFLLYITHVILVLLLVTSLILARRLLRWCSRRYDRRGSLATLWAYAAVVRDTVFPGLSSDRMANKVYELQTARLAKRFRFIHTVWGPVQGLFLFLNTDWRYLAASWGGPWPPLPETVAATVIHQMVFVLFVSTWGVDLFVKAPGPNFIRSFATAMVGFWVVCIYFINQGWDEFKCFEYTSYVLLFRLGLTYWVYESAYFGALQIVYCVAACSLSPHATVIQLELFGMLGILVFQFYQLQYSAREIKATLEATTSLNFLGAMDVLLHSICDVVVHLSPELLIDKPSPHLQTMLLRSSQAGFVGSSILGFAEEAEARRLEAFFRRESDTAGVLHSSLLDGNGTRVQVQLFHAKGFDIARDETFHVVGIQETGEERAQPPPSAQAAPGPVIQMGGVAAISEGSTLSSRSSDENSTTVWVDHTAEGLPIARSSIGCRRLRRPCAAREKLLDWVEGPGRQRLREAVDRCHLAGADPRGGRLSLVLPPDAGGARRSLRLSMEVECEQAHSGQCLAKLRLKRAKRGPPRPGTWGLRRSGPERRPRAALDHENCLAVALDVLDPGMGVLDVSSSGRAPDIDARVGDSFLDFLEEPDTFLCAAMGALLHTGSADRLGQILARQATDLAACIRDFRPSEIGSFTLRRTQGTGSVYYTLQVAVLRFFTYNAGEGLCALVALGKSKAQ